MYGFVIVIAAFIISLLVFPKYRPHIIGGTVVIGLLLYFTTDKDIREQRNAFKQIKQAEVAVFDAVLEWNGTSSAFRGRVRNSSRHYLGEVGIGVVVVSCMKPEDFQAVVDAVSALQALKEKGGDMEAAEDAPVTDEPRIMENGTFMNTRRETRADVLKHAKIKAQSHMVGNVDLKCGIVESKIGTIVLDGGLPPGRERPAELPLSFDIPLPETGHLMWYWGVDSAAPYDDSAKPEKDSEKQTEKQTEKQSAEPAAPEQNQQ